MLTNVALFNSAIWSAPIIHHIIHVIALLSVFSYAVSAFTSAGANRCLQIVPKDAFCAESVRCARKTFRGTSLAIICCLVVVIADRAILSNGYRLSALTLVLKEEVAWITNLTSQCVLALPTICLAICA